MSRLLSIDDNLLEGFEYPVCLVVEVTKQGVLLSKLRYLKSLGQEINETIRCPVIEVYMHMGTHVDSYLKNGGARPTGIDWIFIFELDRTLFRETMKALKAKKVNFNMNNPMTTKSAANLMEKIKKGKTSFKKLEPVEKGLILEPYCNLAFQKAGEGKRIILQNVMIIDREAAIRVSGPGYDDVYTSESGPAMEADILVITEISNVHNILDGLRQYGFFYNHKLA